MRRPRTEQGGKANTTTGGLEAAYLAGGQARKAKGSYFITVYEALAIKLSRPRLSQLDPTVLVEVWIQMHAFNLFYRRRNKWKPKHQRKQIMVITPLTDSGPKLDGQKDGLALHGLDLAVRL